MIEGREVRESKIKEVEELAEMIKTHKVVGILTLQKTPAAALQSIKSDLKEEMKIRIFRKSIMQFALDKIGRQDLKEYVGDSPGALFSNMDPFKLYLKLEKSRIPIYAKPRDIAKEDIIIKAGPTDLPPGPAISSLSKVSLPAKVMGANINILKDKTVCKAGEPISIDLSSVLQLLKIKTMNAGLNVVVMDEEGKIYTKDQLYIDEERLMSDVKIASMNAINLSLNISYPTKVNIQMMIMIANLNAKALESQMGTEKKVKEEPAKAAETVEPSEKVEQAPKEEKTDVQQDQDNKEEKQE